MALNIDDIFYFIGNHFECFSVRENTCSGNVTETGNISALPDSFPRWQHQHTV